MVVAQPTYHLRLRKRLAAALNRLRRTTGVGNYWYWIDVPELADGIDIAQLICPLRYDVLIRRDFLAWYGRTRALYAADFDGFVALARHEPYYRWFMTSEAIRCKQQLLGDPAALELAFAERVRRAAAVYESMVRDGFQTRYPIVLKTAEQLLPPTTDPQGPSTGKQIAQRYFLADGCHRLAMLLLLGQTWLPGNYLRVKCFRTFSPFDSTHALTHAGAIEPKAYFAFLSRGYCPPNVFEDRTALLGHIAACDPERLAEVESVLRADESAAAVARESHMQWAREG